MDIGVEPTGLPLDNITKYFRNKKIVAEYVEKNLYNLGGFTSITITKPVRSEDYCVTIAIYELLDDIEMASSFV